MAAGDGVKRSILLVEDEAIIALAEKAGLEARGFLVRHVMSGEEAVRVALGAEAPELALMDIDLGRGIDGTEAARRILAERDLPIVFLSSHTEPEIVDRTEAIGSYGYVVKNSGMTVLEASIRMAFRLFEAKRAAAAIERRLQDANHLLEHSQRAAELGSWMLDVASGRLSWSDEVYRIFGAAPRSFPATYEAFLGAVHPEDRATVDATYSTSLADGSPGYEIEHRIVRLSDGTTRIVYERCAHERGPDGLVTRSIGIVQDVTERRAAEREFKVKEERYRGVIELAMDGFWIVDLAGRFLDVNEAYCRMSGYRREELLQMRIGDVEAAESADETAAHIARVVETKADRFLTKHRRRDGSVYDLEVSAQYGVDSSGFGAIWGFLRDVTLVRKMEEQLRASEERYRTLFKLSPLPFVVTQDEKTALVNPAAVGFFRVADESELIGRPPKLWIEPEYADLARTRRERVLAEGGQAEPAELRFRLVDGDKIAVIANLTRIEYGGRPALLSVFQDITELKAAQEETARQLRERGALLRELQHRIKNNIASIGAYLHLQAQSCASPEAKAALAEAYGRTESIRLLYEKLLLGEAYRELSAKRYLEELCQAVMAALGAPSGMLTAEIEDLPFGVQVLGSLGVIVNELLTNSVKYSGVQGRAAAVAVRLGREGDSIRLEVPDDGASLPEGFKLEEAGGLGIMLVRMLAEQLGGVFSLGLRGGHTVAELNFPYEAA